jgi:competence protein ComEC
MLDTSMFSQVVNQYYAEPHASLLNGILFGIDLNTTSAFKEQLKQVGLIHLVVLSGSNITLLSSIISSVTIRLGKKFSLVFSIVGIILFVWFVGPEPPVVRAACMAVLTSTALILGRQYIVLYGLLLSVLFIAVVWPSWVTSISFQLSYAATIGLLLFGKISYHKNPHSEEQTKQPAQHILAYVGEELRISLAAQVFTVPLIGLYFQQISFVAPLANVAVAWMIAPLMIFGFCTVLLGSIHPWLGLLPSSICYVLLHIMTWVVEILSSIPYASISWGS